MEIKTVTTTHEASVFNKLKKRKEREADAEERQGREGVKSAQIVNSISSFSQVTHKEAQCGNRSECTAVLGREFSSTADCRCLPSIQTCYLGMLMIILKRDAALE